MSSQITSEFQLVPLLSNIQIAFEKLGYGFAVPGRLGWMLFETVQLVSFILSFALTPSPVTVSPESLPTRYTIASLFVVHYLHRAFIYPVKAHSLAPVRSDILFQSMGYNGLIGYLNGRTAGFVGSYTGDEMRDWTFWGAVSIFAVGMWINITSDYSMFELRRKRDSKKIDDKDVVVLDGRRYVLPRGFLWDYVAAPHYFGEIIEWTGFTLAARSPAALAFLVFTAANLIPRAMMAHQWYIEKFGARYPENRRAVFPFVL
ncbi:3-oxo-5-alpha-steroid 4-dehydrogenase-domain-containing protein [Cladochytrium replicatum]|nr:3-oxo-5-alpha-steroid 4-dehydrogenase-domain-containing protein [Cladochytrium replicatum]